MCAIDTLRAICSLFLPNATVPLTPYAPRKQKRARLRDCGAARLPGCRRPRPPPPPPAAAVRHRQPAWIQLTYDSIRSPLLWGHYSSGHELHSSFQQSSDHVRYFSTVIGREPAFSTICFNYLGEPKTASV